MRVFCRNCAWCEVVLSLNNCLNPDCDITSIHRGTGETIRRHRPCSEVNRRLNCAFYEPKTDDRKLLENIQKRFEESHETPGRLRDALRKKLRGYLGKYIPQKRPIVCWVCDREIPQKPRGARRRLCNVWCRKKWKKIQRSQPAYKRKRAELDARPEQKARRRKYMKEAYNKGG